LGKIRRNLPAAKERVRRKSLIDLVHQIDRHRIKANRLVIYTGASGLDLCSLCGSYYGVQTGSSLQPLWQKIISHRQLTNPGVKLFDLAVFNYQPFW